MMTQAQIKNYERGVPLFHNFILNNMYFVENFSEEFLFVYTQCFSNNKWIENYGLNPTNFNIHDYIQNSVLFTYENVKRIIISDKKHSAFGFAHLCFEKNNCVVVGGVLPDMINSGKGIYTAIITYDYLFQKNTLDTITIAVLKTNQNSLKMNFKMGFIKINEVHSDIGTKFILTLDRTNFPNKFCSIFLARIKYEIR